MNSKFAWPSMIMTSFPGYPLTILPIHSYVLAHCQFSPEPYSLTMSSADGTPIESNLINSQLFSLECFSFKQESKVVLPTPDAPVSQTMCFVLYIGVIFYFYY